MEPDKPLPLDYSQPVAYDADGKPLYAHSSVERGSADVPTENNANKQPDSSKKSTNGNDETIKIKHERSRKDFPHVSLGDEEYIVAVVTRHPIGLFFPLMAVVFLIASALVVLFNYDLVVQSLQLTGVAANPSVIFFPVLAFIGCAALGAYAVYYVYINNKLFLTNRNLIQKIQTAPFSEREQIVGLANIEDVSYSQSGIIQQLFDYGSIQLTIEGYGAVYQFEYAMNPKEYIVIFDNTIENFQNHHPFRSK